MARLRGIAAVVALFLVNAWIAGRWFYTEYTVELGSIDAAFIGLARYIRFHFPESSFFGPTWFPLWYCGIPYPDSYPPLLHLLNAAAAFVFRISPALAYHAVCSTIYALAPCALYWLARRLGAGIAGAFTGGLLYSLISPSCFLIREIRGDAGGWFAPRRFQNMAHYGEGPHQFAMLLLPFAIGFLYLAFEKKRPVYYFGAGVTIAAVALTNWLGGFALAFSIAALLLSGLGGKGMVRWMVAAAIGIFAYALAMPWMTPSVVATIRANAPYAAGGYQFLNRARWAVAIAIVLMLLLAWLMSRFRVQPQLRFGLLFLFAAASITLSVYWLRIELIPQPTRYHIELDLAFWLLVALAFPLNLRKTSAGVLAACLILFLVPAAIHQKAMGRHWTRPINIKSTVQYEISTWLGENMVGRRVFAPGSIGFWMTAFSDTPMITGGFENGIRNLYIRGVNYQVYIGDSQDLAIAYMKTLGVDAIIACEEGSREYYPVYKFKQKFRGLPELWRHGGDVIYAVPRGTSSLAHAMHESDLPKVTPVAYETTIIADYLHALEDPSLPRADFQWRGSNAAVITADLRPEHIISVQVTWDDGWHARVNGKPVRIWGDKAGQIAIAPECKGPCTVEMSYDGAPIDRFAMVLSPLAFFSGLAWVLIDAIRRRRSTAVSI